MQKETIWNKIGLMVGITTIFLGIAFIIFPADSYETRRSKDISFGGDYYTYQYKVTRNAERNAAVAANNIREIGKKLALYYGTIFIVSGVLIVIYFQEKLLLSNNEVSKYETSINMNEGGL